MSMLAIALASAPASQACGCSVAPTYSSYQSYSSNYAFRPGYGYSTISAYSPSYAYYNNGYQYGTWTGAAAPVYSYYTPLPRQYSLQAPVIAAPSCGCQKKGFFNYFK